jgi:hypothetical protein
MKKISVIYILLLLSQSLFAQYHYFGRNKVQYTDFNWQILKTEHFDIFFYPEMRYMAEIGAKYAEESYSVLQVKFDHNVQRRIPLVFYSTHQHFEQSNITSGFIPEGVGGFFEFMKGRVVIPFMGSIGDFRHVIRHELTHVFMHSKITRVLKDHRIPLERYPPLWYVEGLAEHMSAEWDDQAEMIIRDAVWQDYIVGLDNIEQISGSFAMYKIGQHILQYISQHYGEEKIQLLIDNLWKGKSFQEVFKITIGLDFEEFDKIYINDLKKKYFPLLSKMDLPSATSTAIQTEGFNSKPVIYKHGDSTETIFIGNHTGYTSIYRKELNNHSDLKMLVQGEKSGDYEAFHLFSSKISVSKEGLLAFATKSGENDVLYIFDVQQEKTISSFKDNNLVMISSPSWSNDGKRIAFTGVDKGGFSDLYILEVASNKLTRLTNDLYDDRDPCFSPNDDRLVFSSDRSSTRSYNLFLYDLNDNNISYLTYGEESYSTPHWAKDGRKIFFTSNMDGVLNVWAIDSSQFSKNLRRDNLATREIRKITNFSTSAYDPEYTENDQLIFSSFENFKFHIRMIDSVSRRFDTSAFIHKFDFSKITDPWTIDTKEISSTATVEPYQESYNLDIAASQVSTDPIFGTNAGAVVAFSDLLGNDQYYFLLYNNAQSKDEILSSFNIAITRTSLHKRMNYAYGIFNFSGRRYDLTDVDEFYWERVFGGYFVLSYPLNVFQRIEASTQISNSDKDNYSVERKALMVSNSLSFISDNSMWTSTGPIDGHRAFISLAFTSDIKHSNVNYYTLLADYRQYFRLTTRSAIASRFQLFWNEGKEARRYFMGGSWDLRGYDRWSLRGTKLWLTSHELRFPLIDAIGVKFPFGGIGFGAIRGALFFDAGSVWDTKYEDTKGSFGLGLRLNFLGAIVFRYDTGYKIIDNFRTVDKTLFQQFFFGWDF